MQKNTKRRSKIFIQTMQHGVFETLTPESTRWYHESIALLSQIKQEDVEVIFFDGFLLIQESEG